MSQKEQVSEPPVLPFYDQTEPNLEIDFGSHNVKIKNERRVLNARVRFLPNVSVDLEIPNNPRSFKGFFDDDESGTEIDFYESGVKLNTYCRSANSERSIYFLQRSPSQLCCDSNSISHATLHFFNWPDLSGSNDMILRFANGGGKRLGHTCISFGEWQLQLCACIDTKEASH